MKSLYLEEKADKTTINKSFGTWDIKEDSDSWDMEDQWGEFTVTQACSFETISRWWGNQAEGMELSTQKCLYDTLSGTQRTGKIKIMTEKS